MARNRRHQSGAVRFVPALKTILLCMLIGGSAVGYVLQKNKLHELGRTISKKEAALEKLRLENKIWRDKLSELQSPLKLAERVREQKMNLFPPPPGQTIWLPEPALSKPLPEAPSTASLLAIRND